MADEPSAAALTPDTAGTEAVGRRRYGGRDGADRKAERRARLLDAGLDQLGSGEPISVRGSCKRAGLVSRYFYESFSDRDELTREVYHHVVERVATAATTAVAEAGTDRDTVIRSGLRSIIRAIADDPRLGRVLFATDPALSELTAARAESSRLFVGLLTGTVTGFYGIEPNDRLEVVAHFLVGGFGQALTAWLAGTPDISEDDLVELGTELFAGVASALRAPHGSDLRSAAARPADGGADPTSSPDSPRAE